MVRNAELRGVARFLLESVSGVGLILILALGGRDVAAGRMEWPTLMGLLVAVMALYQPIVNVLHTYGTLRSALPNLARVQQIVTAPTTIRPRVSRPVALQTGARHDRAA